MSHIQFAYIAYISIVLEWLSFYLEFDIEIDLIYPVFSANLKLLSPNLVDGVHFISL